MSRRSAAEVRRCPSSLYTFPVLAFGLGLGSGLPFEGFPEFGQFCTASFPAGTQSLQVRCVYQFRHARVTDQAIAVPQHAAKHRSVPTLALASPPTTCDCPPESPQLVNKNRGESAMHARPVTG